ncbi:laminin subunit beta-1-like [Oncorhynchus mykiss]|uniref:laminin subunit beta-1-like n=1 Tax=Oncorhynchus mykiss TaxID=8022 RepID=UPI0018786076|nr:laminin subunit beta-1-like [Oncorhynchus mykiss]
MTVMRPSVVSTNSRCANTMPDDDNQMVFLHPGTLHLVLPGPGFSRQGWTTVSLSLPRSPHTHTFNWIVLMPYCKNLEIFTGSEVGDLTTNSSWDTFQRYRCLENMPSVCCNFISSVSVLLHQGAKGALLCEALENLPGLCRYVCAGNSMLN